MNIHIHADAQNTKNILTLIEEQGFSLPCNCHGAHRCNGARYSFDCSLIPKKPMDVSLPDTSDKIQSVSLEKMETSDGTADTLLIDLGTTTIAMAFIDKESGALRQCKTSANPQAHFGSDVISRIQAATHGNLSDLTDCIRKHIKKETALLCQMTHNDISAIRFCYIGGNTTMIHLLFGYDCTSLGHSPFTIKVPSPEPLSIGNCTVYTAPWISAFVGGDITAGTLAADIWDKDEMSLFIDLGTNGEIVFGNRDFLMSCACSAGPAFEGGDISCGMRATDGAIEACTIDNVTMEPTLSIVGDPGQKPVGICGSGIIDIISELYRCRIINAKGLFVREGSRIQRDAHGMGRYIIATSEESETSREVSINEVDIDNFIRAKGAIFSAIDTLLKSVDMTPECIDRVYVAGGIGSGINMKNAVNIGMFPDVELEKFRYIGNSSLSGSYAMVMSDEAIEKTSEVASNMTYLELSTHPGYMDAFVAACFIPHTDRSLFPSCVQA